MGYFLNRHAYERLLREELAWLLRQPQELERDHIAEVLRRELDTFSLYEQARQAHERGLADGTIAPS